MEFVRDPKSLIIHYRIGSSRLNQYSVTVVLLVTCLLQSFEWLTVSVTLTLILALKTWTVKKKIKFIACLKIHSNAWNIRIAKIRFSNYECDAQVAKLETQCISQMTTKMRSYVVTCGHFTQNISEAHLA